MKMDANHTHCDWYPVSTSTPYLCTCILITLLYFYIALIYKNMCPRINFWEQICVWLDLLALMFYNFSSKIFSCFIEDYFFKFLWLLWRQGLPVSQVGLQLIWQSRLTLNFQFSCFSLPTARIIDMSHHAQ